MSKRMADVKITTNIRIPDWNGMLPRLGARVLEGEGEKMLSAVQGQWRDWRYVRYVRKDGTPVVWSQQFTGESGRAWTMRVQATENPFGIVLLNEVRSIYPGQHGKSYAAHVHRAGNSTPEHKVVFDLLTRQYVPVLRDRMIEFIRAALQPGPRKKVIAKRDVSGARSLSQIAT